MNFTQAIASGFRNYANSSGRASRSEYWYWTLFSLIIDIVAWLLDTAIFPGNAWGPISIAASLWLLLPSVAVSMRRLHDINRTGYWVLLIFTIVGIILLMYWSLLKGSDGDNDYGPDPLAQAAHASATG